MRYFHINPLAYHLNYKADVIHLNEVFPCSTDYCFWLDIGSKPVSSITWAFFGELRNHNNAFASLGTFDLATTAPVNGVIS